jgi:uncharacterized FlaG/YvyC family protein
VTGTILLITFQHERQVAKEETEAMRQQLDEGLDSIRSLLNFRVSQLMLEIYCKWYRTP